MALRADKANLTDFAKKAEQLAEAFQRSLVLEGTSRAKAIELTVEKTIDLCKVNTTSTLVKSALISSKFENAKEAIAKFTIETRNASNENQVLQFRSNNRGNGRGNYQRNRNWNNNFNNFSYNNNNNGFLNNNYRNNSRGFNNNNNNFRGRGHYRGNYRGNFRGNGRNGQNSVNHFTSQNGNAPPSGAQQIEMRQAE